MQGRPLTAFAVLGRAVGRAVPVGRRPTRNRERSERPAVEPRPRGYRPRALPFELQALETAEEGVEPSVMRTPTPTQDSSRAYFPMGHWASGQATSLSRRKSRVRISHALLSLRGHRPVAGRAVVDREAGVRFSVSPSFRERSSAGQSARLPGEMPRVRLSPLTSSLSCRRHSSEERAGLS